MADAPVARVPRRGSATRTRRTPARSKSAITTVTARQPLPTSSDKKKKLPGRSKSTSGATLSGKVRKKKKGIRVAIVVKKKEEEEGGEKPSKEEQDDPDADLKLYQLDVNCSGKYKEKVGWPEVDAFWADQRDVDKDIMCDLLEQYSTDYYPERVNADNLKPKRVYLQDCKMRGISYYKDYSWDPVELHLRGRGDIEPVEIMESYTKQIKLEDIPYTGMEDINAILLERGDKSVTSTLKKSKLQGHPLALAMMTSETQIVTEFRGLESVVGVLGNDDDTIPKEVDEDGNQIWRDVKTLRTLLHDKPLPVKEGKGALRILEVIGLETYIKARISYKAFFEGDVVSDHGIGLLLGERWWAHPLKDIMSGFKMDNAAMIYEDIELRFYSEIGYKMDNEYFDWENIAGKWTKVMKTREP